MRTSHSRNHILGLEKGLAVIQCFGDQNQKLTISDVAGAAGLSRAAARRCLLTLEHLGYAEFDGKFFRLTFRVLRLGYAYLSSAPLPQVLQLHIEKLSNETHESCSAAILDKHEVVYIAKSTVRRILASGVNIGSRLPAYCTASGRVLLSALPPREARKILTSQKLPALTQFTKTHAEPILESLEQVRIDGYCLVEEELELGLISLAVPVFCAKGRVVAALNIGSQRQRNSKKAMLNRFLPLLLKVQNEVCGLIH